MKVIKEKVFIDRYKTYDTIIIKAMLVAQE